MCNIRDIFILTQDLGCTQETYNELVRSHPTFNEEYRSKMLVPGHIVTSLLHREPSGKEAIVVMVGEQALINNPVFWLQQIMCDVSMYNNSSYVTGDENKLIVHDINKKEILNLIGEFYTSYLDTKLNY